MNERTIIFLRRHGRQNLGVGSASLLHNIEQMPQQVLDGWIDQTRKVAVSVIFLIAAASLVVISSSLRDLAMSCLVALQCLRSHCAEKCFCPYTNLDRIRELVC
jgi:hypothetical protein